MTERDAALAGDDRPSDGGTTRPYRPGSRLRRALDLAREAHAQPEPDQSAGAEPGGDHGHADDLPGREAERRAPGDAATPAGARGRDRGRELDVLPLRDEPAASPPPETWQTAAQGWVQTDEGLRWRTVVTTADRLERWTVATYLGIVTGRSHTTTRHPDSDHVQQAGRDAVDQVVAAATARGAHGVIGLTISLADGPDGMTVTAAGTAVTLTHRP